MPKVKSKYSDSSSTGVSHATPVSQPAVSTTAAHHVPASSGSPAVASTAEARAKQRQLVALLEAKAERGIAAEREAFVLRARVENMVPKSRLEVALARCRLLEAKLGGNPLPPQITTQLSSTVDESRLFEAQAEIHSLKEQLAAAHLKAQLAEAQLAAEVQAADEKSGSLALSLENSSLRDSVASLEVSRRDLDRQLADARKDLHVAREKLGDLGKGASKFASTEQHLEGQLEEARKHDVEQEEKITRLTEELTASKEVQASISRQKDAMWLELKEFKERVEKLQKPRIIEAVYLERAVPPEIAQLQRPKFPSPLDDAGLQESPVQVLVDSDVLADLNRLAEQAPAIQNSLAAAKARVAHLEGVLDEEKANAQELLSGIRHARREVGKARAERGLEERGRQEELSIVQRAVAQLQANLDEVTKTSELRGRQVAVAERAQRTAEAQLNSKMAEIHQLRGRLEKNQQRLAAATKQINALKEQITKAASEHRQVHAELRLVKSDVQISTKRRQAAEVRVGRAEEQEEKWRQKFEGLQSERAKLLGDLKTAQVGKEAANNDLNGRREEVQRFRADIRRLQQENHRLNSLYELEREGQAVAKKTAQILTNRVAEAEARAQKFHAYEGKSKTLNQDLERERARATNLEATVKERRERSEFLEQQLTEAIIARKEAVRSASRLQKELTDYKLKIERVEAEERENIARVVGNVDQQYEQHRKLLDLETALGEANGKIHVQTNQLHRVEDELKEASEARETMKLRHHDMKAGLATAKEALAAEEEENRELKKQLDLMKSMPSADLEQLVETQHRVEDLTKELDEQKARVEDLLGAERAAKESLERVKIMDSELQESEARVAVERAAATDERAKAKAAFLKMREISEAAHRDRASRKKRLKQARALCDELQEVVRLLKDDNLEHKGKRERAEEQLRKAKDDLKLMHNVAGDNTFGIKLQQDKLNQAHTENVEKIIALEEQLIPALDAAAEGEKRIARFKDLQDQLYTAEEELRIAEAKLDGIKYPDDPIHEIQALRQEVAYAEELNEGSLQKIATMQEDAEAMYEELETMHELVDSLHDEVTAAEAQRDEALAETRALQSDKENLEQVLAELKTQRHKSPPRTSGRSSKRAGSIKGRSATVGRSGGRARSGTMGSAPDSRPLTPQELLRSSSNSPRSSARGRSKTVLPLRRTVGATGELSSESEEEHRMPDNPDHVLSPVAMTRAFDVTRGSRRDRSRTVASGELPRANTPPPLTDEEKQEMDRLLDLATETEEAQKYSASIEHIRAAMEIRDTLELENRIVRLTTLAEKKRQAVPVREGPPKNREDMTEDELELYDRLLADAKAYEEKGDLEMAITKYEDACDLAPFDIELYIPIVTKMAETLEQREEEEDETTEEGPQTLEGLPEAQREEYEKWMTDGKAFEKERDFHGALNAYQKAAAIAPFDLRVKGKVTYLISCL